MDKYKLYERQLNAVEDLVEFHPEFLDALTPEEKRVFKRYFMPDWDNENDFRAYLDELLGEEPGIQAKAQVSLGKFLNAGGIDPEYLLPQE